MNVYRDLGIGNPRGKGARPFSRMFESLYVHFRMARKPGSDGGLKV